MPVGWRFVGRILVVTETGVTANDEIEKAFVREALQGVKGARVLWDSRTSHAALSAEDMEWRASYLRQLAQEGRLTKFALLTREDQRLTTELLRAEVPKVVSPLQYAVFVDEEEALWWLGA